MLEDKLKQEIKQDLTTYYDSIRIEINKHFEDSQEHEQLLKDYLLNQTNQIFNLNCKEIDNYFESEKQHLNNEIEDIKSNAINKYCAVVLSAKNDESINKYDLALVICDWYLTKNHLEFLRVKRKCVENKKIINLDLDRIIIYLNYCLDNLTDFATLIQTESQNKYENILFNFEKDKIQHELSKITKLKLHFSMSHSKTQTEEQSLLFAKFIGASHLKQAEVHVNLVDGFLADLKSLLTIDLSLDSINKINVNSFKDACVNLEMIDLIECNLKTIEDESFKNLPNLKKLFLHENNLTFISSKTLSGLFNLTELNISKCEIESIEDNSFADLHNLEILNLSFNSFHSIHKNTFFGLKKLKCICLDSCGIKSIEDNSFLHLNNLLHLDLSHSYLNRITPSLFAGLSNLKTLNLTTCNIVTIENDSFKHLKMLTNLIMKSNKIKLIDPNTFDGLDSLVELDLSNCNIEFIHFNSFQNLPKLTDLYFSFEFYDNISSTITYDELGLKDKSVIKFKGYFN